MKRNRLLLYFIIFLEGYVVLATELLTIRQLIPFVGNGTETVALIIAAVLMPLAFGYYAGGNFKSYRKNVKPITVRDRLVSNVLNASIILAIGLSYVFLEFFFTVLNQVGIINRLAQTTIFLALFIVYPVYVLGQTVPLISNYLRHADLSKTTGIILAFSTIGSFFGATLSTLVLMTTVGVHNVVIVNTILLFFVVLILNKRLIVISNFKMAAIVTLSVLMNGGHVMAAFGIVEDNNYNTIAVFEGSEPNTKILYANRSYAAKFSNNPEERFAYIHYLERNYLNPLFKSINVEKRRPKKILVVGAGGFTFGQDDTFNHYTFVDIDASLKEVSETHFQEKKLQDNKRFMAIPVRGLFNQTQEKYDLIFLDAYTNEVTIPFQLITVEFFEQAKAHLSEEGILIFNVITSPNFNDAFSVKLDNTFRRVFGAINRQVVSDFNHWQGEGVANIIYSYYHKPQSKDDYTDNMNTYYLDR